VRNCSSPETAAPRAPLRKTFYVAHHGSPVCEGGTAEAHFGTEGYPPREARVVALPTLWGRGHATPPSVDLRVSPGASCEPVCEPLTPRGS
jgi:hypothetical protein